MNMIMKQLNFKIVLLFLTIYVCPHRTLAQKDTLLYRTLIQDSILIPQKSQATIEEEEGIFTEVPKHYRKYDKRVHRYRSAWESRLPTHCAISETDVLVARFRQELYSYKADAASHTDGKSVAAPEYLLFTLDDSCSRLVSVPCCDTCFFASSCGKMNTQN